MTRPVPDSTTRSRLASRVLVLALVAMFIVGTLGFISAVISAGEAEQARATDAPTPVQPAPGQAATAEVSPRSPGPSSLGASPAISPDALGSPGPTGPSAVLPSPAASPSALGSSAPDVPAELAAMPVAPIVGFWSSEDGLSLRDVRRALQSGRLDGFGRVAVEDSVRDALASSLGLAIAAGVQGGDAERVSRAVSKGALGFLAAADIGPGVRALEVDGRSMFGNGRVGRTERWPLRVKIPVTPERRWDQRETWVLVAGGDSFTDRGVYETVVNKGRGVGYPFGGGTANVTGHRCCDPVFHDNEVPVYKLTGDRGAVRRLFRDAEIAIVNHESPITDGWSHHRSGFTFTGKPELTKIFTNAGIDWVSLANNHIKDHGTLGIEDTRRILKRHGIAFGGAGKDLRQARRVEPLEVAGVRLAIVPCVGVAPHAWAGPRTSGGTPCKGVTRDVRRAARDADLVIVFPHWGTEYTRQPSKGQRAQAAAWVKAGADLVLGAHSHVAGAIDDVDGVPVLFSIGNLIFDQWWSTNTMEGVIVEATFHSDELKQIRLHPFVTHAQAQPNLLDPGRGEGRRLLRAIRAASRPELDW